MDLQLEKWLGNAVGSSLGLLALLIGAAVNAGINRRRDDRMRNEERKTVASAIAAELSCYSHALVASSGLLAGHAKGEWYADAEPQFLAKLAELPSTLVVDGLGARVGLLNAVMAARVISIWYDVCRERSFLAMTLEEITAGRHNVDVLEDRHGRARDLALRCDRLAFDLCGERMGFLAPLKTLGPGSEEALMVLGKSGTAADRAEEMRRAERGHEQPR